MKLLSLCIVVMLDRMLHTDAHGYLKDPPMRSYMSQSYPGYGFTFNNDYNQLFCGGTKYQWVNHNGKCGVCGDPYGAAYKPNEDIDGIYVTNFITRTYKEGSIIEVKVKLSANHRGWFEFRLCPLDHVGALVTQACLDRNLLKLAKDDTTRYPVTDGNDFNIQLKLPDGLICEQCVLQWWYKTGNNWGCHANNGECCLGCGEKQETFVNCADISIIASESKQPTDQDGNPYPGIELVPTTPWETDPQTASWETDLQTDPPAPQTTSPPVTTKVKTTKLAEAELTTKLPSQSDLDVYIVCYSVGIFSPTLDTWCMDNCLHDPPYCPKNFCKCEMH